MKAYFRVCKQCGHERPIAKSHAKMKKPSRFEIGCDRMIAGGHALRGSGAHATGVIAKQDQRARYIEMAACPMCQCEKFTQIKRKV